MFNNDLWAGEIPPSWSEVTMVPIPKPGKDTTRCESYRPIALLNIDMKILATILSTHLQKIITQYIALDQTGFIPGQLMSDNICKTLNLINYWKQRHIQLLFLALDFEKAFDSIKFMSERRIQHMNFGNNFQRLFAALYQQPEVTLKINGKKSQRFWIGWGTRQGCPLSPLLFTLCIQPLANLIQTSPLIHGI